MKTGIFRGFGIPSFGILDMWWVVTPNGTPSELMLYWFAVKLFSCKLRTGYRKSAVLVLAPPTLETS